LAGLRVGYGYASPEMIGLLNRVRQPFNLNSVAQAAAIAALDDRDHVRTCRQSNAEGLQTLSTGLARLGLESIPSVANFISVKVGDGAGVFEALQARGLIVRPMAGYGMGEWIRVSVGTPAENERLLQCLGALTCGAGQAEDS
jgi:histidinol-phosphate aminotransferase